MRSFPRTIPTPARLAAGLLAAALLLAPAAGQAANPKVIPIAIARLLPLGTVVTVDGSVTTPSGDFASSFFDEGFAVQDRTGGIYISLQENLGLDVREQARVTGALANFGGLLVLLPTDGSDVKVHGKGPKVDPIRVATGSVGPANQGKLVQVVGTIDQPVFDDQPFGFKVFVDDGSGEIRVYVNLQTGIDVSGLAAGQRVLVTGFSGEFETPEIDVRFPSDIQVLP